MSELIKAIAVTAEVLGTEWSEGAARLIAEALSAYPVDDVKHALFACTKEVRGRLTLADILDRLPGGHPGPEEAWSVVGPSLQNEGITVVWTDPMREAFGVAIGLADDPTAARMAFKESYTKLVSQARTLNHKPTWSVSLGTDKHGRERAIREAVKTGKLSMSYATRFLPPPDATGTSLANVGNF